MKNANKLATVLVVAILSMTAAIQIVPPAEAAAQNLIQNNWFTDGLTHWNTRGICIRATAATTWGHFDAPSAYVHSTCTLEAGTDMLYQEVSVIGGASYHASAYFNLHQLAIDGPSLAIIWLKADGSEAGRDKIQVYQEPGVTSTLPQILVANAPATATRAQVGVLLGTGTSSATFMDSVSFKAEAPLTTPGAPKNVKATGGPAHVHLTWGEALSTGVISGIPAAAYLIERKTAGSWQSLAFIPKNWNSSVSYTDAAVVPYVVYEYRVTAWNPAGFGPASPTASASAQEAPPVRTAPLLNVDFQNGLNNWTRTGTCWVSVSTESEDRPRVKVRVNGTIVGRCGIFQDVALAPGNASLYEVRVREFVSYGQVGDVGKLALAFIKADGSIASVTAIYAPDSGEWPLAIQGVPPPGTTKVRVVSESEGHMQSLYYAGPFALEYQTAG